MNAEPAFQVHMTAEEFFLWAESWTDGERYELVNGVPAVMQSERVSHAERKLAVTLSLRAGLREAGLDSCRAFIDGVSVRVNDHTVREPDVVVNCGPYDRDGVFAPNPVVVVEVVSPSSVKTDLERKLIDYFAVPSILHYLVVFDDGRVIHHRRRSFEAEITTTILGRDGEVDLSPAGLRLSVASFFDDEPDAAVQ